MQDKIPAGDIKERSAFLKWLDNYWYHNKIPTIAATAGIVILIICICQTCTRTDSFDMSVLYAGRVGLTQNEHLLVSNVISTALPEDYNNDGRKSVEFTAYHILSEEQIKKLAAETHEDGSHVYVDRAFYSKEYENYTNMMTTGEYSVCLLEPWLYEKMESAGRLKKLSEVLDKIPESAISEYGIALGSTELYAYYDALRVLPEDTVLCLMQPFVIGQSSKAENYAKCISVFQGVVEFKSPSN